MPPCCAPPCRAGTYVRIVPSSSSPPAALVGWSRATTVCPAQISRHGIGERLDRMDYGSGVRSVSRSGAQAQPIRRGRLRRRMPREYYEVLGRLTVVPTRPTTRRNSAASRGSSPRRQQRRPARRRSFQGRKAGPTRCIRPRSAGRPMTDYGTPDAIGRRRAELRLVRLLRGSLRRPFRRGRPVPASAGAGPCRDATSQ